MFKDGRPSTIGRWTANNGSWMRHHWELSSGRTCCPPGIHCISRGTRWWVWNRRLGAGSSRSDRWRFGSCPWMPHLEGCWSGQTYYLQSTCRRSPGTGWSSCTLRLRWGWTSTSDQWLGSSNQPWMRHHQEWSADWTCSLRDTRLRSHETWSQACSRHWDRARKRLHGRRGEHRRKAGRWQKISCLRFGCGYSEWTGIVWVWVDWFDWFAVVVVWWSEGCGGQQQTLYTRFEVSASL